MKQPILPAEFDRGIKSGAIKNGAFLLIGEEGYLMFNSLRLLRKTCFPDGDDYFGHTVVSSPVEPVTPLTVAVDSVSVFSEKKLIELSEFSWPTRAKDVEKLCSEILPLCEKANESEDTFLVFYTTPFEFDAGNPPKRPSKLYETLCEQCTPIIYSYESEAKLVKWMGRRAAALGATLPPAIAQEIITRAGRSMFCLIGEVEKAAFTALSQGRDVIDTQDLALTVNNEEIAAFDFENALRGRNYARALTIMREHEKDKDPPELVSAVIYNYAVNIFSAAVYRAEGKSSSAFASSVGLNPYVADYYYRAAASAPDIKKLEENVRLCSETDLTLKTGGGGDDFGYLMLENLLYRLVGQKG